VPTRIIGGSRRETDLVDLDLCTVGFVYVLRCDRVDSQCFLRAARMPQVARYHIPQRFRQLTFAPHLDATRSLSVRGGVENLSALKRLVIRQLSVQVDSQPKLYTQVFRPLRAVYSQALRWPHYGAK